MKKIAAITIALIIIGNALIMILERYWVSNAALSELQHNLFSDNLNQAAPALYPAQMLFKKICIWMICFSTLATVLHFIPVQRKRLIRNLLIGFYVTGCFTNVFIVPHPAWFILFTLAIVPLAFIVVENLLTGMEQIGWHFKNSRSASGNPNMEANPA